MTDHFVDFDAVNAAARANLLAVLARVVLPNGRRDRREYLALNPRRADRRLGSFQINLETGKWADFATGDKGGDPISLVAYVDNVSQFDAALQASSNARRRDRALATRARAMNDGINRYRPLTADERKTAAPGGNAIKADPPTIPPLDAGSAEDAARKVFRRKPHATWTYRNARGDPLFHVARFDDGGGKKILPLCWTARGWKNKAWPAPRPLYNLDKIALRPDAKIIICEGEKAADAAALIFPDFVVTTSSGGAQSAAQTDWAPLAKAAR